MAGAGFGYGVFGTTTFGEEAETANFETEIAKEFNEPILQFVFDNRTFTNFVIDAPTISRGANIIAGTATIVLSNTPTARIDGITIAFVEGGASPDTITDSNNSFQIAGFASGDKITVSGSTSNDGDYTIANGGVAAGVITLIPTNDLTNEGAAALVNIQTQPAFNFILENRIENMGKPCSLNLSFSGIVGSLRLLKGTVEDVKFEGATVTMWIRDKMALMLEKRMGSGPLPVDYYTTVDPFNPADLVWLILTQWGELDDTASADNIHIDYTSWLAWKARCLAHNYQVRARFPGTTILNALLRVGDLTNSFVWVDGAGKFQFSMFEPPYSFSASDRAYDTDNAVAIDVAIEKSTVKNAVTIYYGHDPDANYEPAATITSNKIGFGNDNPDRIYLVEHYDNSNFLAFGFDTNDPVTVSGSKRNDGIYGIETVEGGVMTMFNSNGLTQETDGASVTLTQSQDTSTIQSTELVFNDNGGGNDTITSAAGIFVIGGIAGTDAITISGSTSNDNTFSLISVTANTLTLQSGVLTQEASGNVVVLTQTHTITLTSTVIGFDDTETGKSGEEDSPADHIFKADVGQVAGVTTFIDFNEPGNGFLPQYSVTVSGSVRNDSTYRLASVEPAKLNLQHQTLADEASGETVTITQEHTNRTTGKQFEASVTGSNAQSVALYGIIALTDDLKVVWHDSQLSASSAVDAKLLIYSFPREIVRIDATMVSFLDNPGDSINATEAYRSMNAKTYFITSIDIDIDAATAEITGERGSEGG